MGFLSSLGQIAGIASPVIGGLEAVSGLIGDSSARQRALQQQQQALQQYGSAMDQQYQNMLGHNNQTLMGAAGQGGTALTNYGSNMGAAMAGAGIYNNSAVAGGLAQQQANTNQALSGLAAQNTYNANSFFNQGQQNLANMRLGQANINYGNANADYHNSQAGLGNFLTTLGQSNLLGGAQGQQAAYDPAYTQQQITANGITDADLYGSGTSSLQSLGSPQGLYGNAGTPSGMGALGQFNLQALGANYNRTALPSINGTLNQGANLGGNAGGIGNGGQGQGGSNPFYQPSYGRGWSDIVKDPSMGWPLGGR